MDYVLIDKKSIFIDKQAIIGKNVIIYENNRIDGKSVIEDNVTIFPGSFIVNSIIGKGTKVYSSFIESSNIGSCCYIGPFCHLKKVSVASKCKILSGTEIKNQKVKLGQEVNIKKIRI